MNIGFFADAHYARGLHIGSRTCDRSLEKVARILEALRGCELIVNLGDLVNATGDAGADARNIAEAMALLGPAMHVVGNHDVEAARKDAFCPAGAFGERHIGDWTLLALDANFTLAGESYEDAAWDWREALIPEAQIDWLSGRLASCGRALVLCHQNLDPREGDPHVVRNAARVREAIERSGKVAAVVQGHCHTGYEQVVNGIPYHTLAAVCEGDGEPYAVFDTDEARFTRFDAREGKKI